MPVLTKRIVNAFVVFVILLSVTGLLSGCDGPSKFSGSYSSTLMLSGKPLGKTTYDFNSDGTVTWTDLVGSHINGTYTASGNEVTVTLPSAHKTVNFTRQGDSLMQGDDRFSRN